ncbi:carbohydrate kinase [Escherichia coli]|nr:carbohydrate kinase [Escherichia coli]EFB1881119.1 carbohydrate kinase [Escherichia coli]EFJ2534863.1 carbohydrate kinase [Escherichia coli]
MHRIDTKTAQKDKFGAGKNGFTRGNPQTGTPATDLDDDYFDMLQEELCSVVEASGASLEKGRHDQLLTALRALLLSRKNPFGDIKSDGTVKTALENLGLGDVNSGRLLNVQVFTSSGLYTPTPGTKKAIVEVQGAGGAGAGTNSPATMCAASGSGTSGAYAKAIIDNPTPQQVTVGSGGKGGVDNPAGNGNAGGQSSFGSLVTAIGGLGGEAMTAGTGVWSAFFSGTMPAVQFTGANIFGRGCGMPTISLRLGGVFSYSGNGGDSIFGAGGIGSRGQSRGGDGVGYGAGGAGANVNGGIAGSFTGGDGVDGVVIVWEYM